MRIGTWKVRSLYRASSLTAVARELMGVQEVRWDSGGSVTAGYYISFCMGCFRKGAEENIGPMRG
jgi:hypothetical protein